MVLPPKRFDNPFDTKFDSIRGKRWFGWLEKSRRDLPRLEVARQAIKADQKLTLGKAALMVGVSRSVLGDYVRFMDGMPLLVDPNKRTNQAVLDEAYLIYCIFINTEDSKSFINCINDASKIFGVNKRIVSDRWMIDSKFYPTGYISS